MTTITIKINERTKVGKAFMALIEAFSKEKKGIEIISEEKSPYNPEFVAKIRRAEKNVRDGKTIRIDPNNVWESIL